MVPVPPTCVLMVGIAGIPVRIISGFAHYPRSLISDSICAGPVGVVISEWGPNLHFSYIRFLHKARTAAAGRLLLSGGSGHIVL